MEIESSVISNTTKQVKHLSAGMPFVWNGNLFMKCGLGGLVQEHIKDVSQDDIFVVNINTGCIIMLQGRNEVIPKPCIVTPK